MLKNDISVHSQEVFFDICHESITLRNLCSRICHNCKCDVPTLYMLLPLSIHSTWWGLECCLYLCVSLHNMFTLNTRKGKKEKVTVLHRWYHNTPQMKHFLRVVVYSNVFYSWCMNTHCLSIINDMVVLLKQLVHVAMGMQN